MSKHEPTTGALVPHTVLEGTVELSAERTAETGAALVWIPGDGRATLLPREDLPPEYFNPALLPVYQPRDLTPQPVVDPVAQRLFLGGAGVGVAGAGLGWGLSQVLEGVAAVSGSGGGALLGVFLGLLLARARGPATTVHHHETHVHNRGLLARSSVTTTGTVR
jgi:hypothetical protein